MESFLNGKIQLHIGDCLDVLAPLPGNSIDSCVTDPPYHLTSIVKRFANAKIENEKYAQTSNSGYMSRGFMGKQWDGGDVAFRPETWAEVYRVLKPGAHLVAFGGTRTYHRMACAIEDAGFEIRDCIQWLYGSGFPKSHDVSKGIDRAAGEQRERIRGVRSGVVQSVYAQDAWSKEFKDSVLSSEPITDAARQWEGWGTALKPACEPIVLARKPLSEKTVAANVLRWGTGAINVDGCRVETNGEDRSARYNGLPPKGEGDNIKFGKREETWNAPDGRWPANVIHDGSDEVLAGFPETHSAGFAREEPGGGSFDGTTGIGMGIGIGRKGSRIGDDSGSAARFFYQVKQDDELCHSINCASNAGERFDLKSEHVVSVLSDAVAMSAVRLMLQKQSYRAASIVVTANELEIICASVTEIIQNLERRYSLGFPHENISAKLPGVRCAAIPKQTGTTTIIIDRSTLGPYVELATFDIIETSAEVGESVSANRLFYTSKADQDDRIGSKHPTVKPLDLMQYLVRLVTPKGGTVLDMFAGSGTTGEAAFREGMMAVLIEREHEYQADIRRRIDMCMAGPDERSRETIKARGLAESPGPLFDSQWDSMWRKPFDRPDLV